MQGQPPPNESRQKPEGGSVSCGCIIHACIAIAVEDARKGTQLGWPFSVKLVDDEIMEIMRRLTPLLRMDRRQIGLVMWQRQRIDRWPSPPRNSDPATGIAESIKLAAADPIEALIHPASRWVASQPAWRKAICAAKIEPQYPLQADRFTMRPMGTWHRALTSRLRIYLITSPISQFLRQHIKDKPDTAAGV